MPNRLVIHWLEVPEVLAQQRVLIDLYGGSHGVRDEGALESTLARPKNLLAYEADTDICRLAACYGYGFARNHCFIDGNKRMALTAMDVFLALHELDLQAAEPEVVAVIVALCTGEMSEEILAAWIARHVQSLDHVG